MARRKGGRKAEPEASSLTYKQTLFVGYYLGEAKGNATQAARMAGYSCAEIGRQLLRNITVRAAIDAGMGDFAMSAAEVLARLSEMAATDLSDFVVIPADGEHRIDLRRAKRIGKTHLVKKLTPTKYGLSIELHDSQSALDKLARMHGLYGDRPSGETYDDIPDDAPDVEPRDDPPQGGVP